MTADPFSLADPTIVAIPGVAFARCPCGWEGAMFAGKREAQPDLDRHLTSVHPDRFRRSLTTDVVLPWTADESDVRR